MNTNPSSASLPTKSKEGFSAEIEDPSQTSTISDGRKPYIMDRHGTLELDPLPLFVPKKPAQLAYVGKRDACAHSVSPYHDDLFYSHMHHSRIP